jgi:hypothetical protein
MLETIHFKTGTKNKIDLQSSKKTQLVEKQLKNLPVITFPQPNTKICDSPVLVKWASNGLDVKKWWLLVGHAPGLSDYFGPKEYRSDEFSESKVKVELTGGDVYFLLRYQDSKGETHDVEPIIECSTKDTVHHISDSHN